MFAPTNNPYHFKYLITGITGEGIPCVYLPELPPDDKVLFEKEQKWVRPEMSSQLKKWSKEWRLEKLTDKKYIHAHAEEILAWEEEEWTRTTDGVWAWINGNKVYLTPFYTWYLSVWLTYFGIPVFRATDLEITYWLQYIEEDPDSYGGALNTIRRYGKSSIFGAWLIYRATRNYNHTVGMQGETRNKISKFYNKMVMKPFYKLPYYYQPTYDTSSTQSNEIKFDIPPIRGKRRSDYDSDESVLESIIDYRATGATEYDGEALDTFYVEEAGKIMEESIYSVDGDGILDIIKPALRKGRQIRGKCMLATTCEFMDATDRGGKAYKELFFDSDFNQRQKDGRTKSGLYAAFLPGDCAYQDFLDEWGYPLKDLARQSIIDERDSFKNNSSKLAGSIRRYPLSISEIFYINPSSCAFSAADVLQDRLREIDTTVGSLFETIDLSWENNVPFSRVIWRKNPQNGWLKINHWPNFDDANKVEKVYIRGKWIYRPLNDARWAIGFDPIQHRTAEGKANPRESRPVAAIKRKYDSAIDGIMDDELMHQRAQVKFPYQTGKYVALMDKRPNDPNVLFNRLLLICWYLGCSAHIEKQKDAVITYFHEKNCGDFVLAKYSHDYEGPQALTDGTAATPRLIEDYTNALDHDITNFWHTNPFREMVEDALLFKPSKTTEHDYTVAAGFCELACKMKPKNIIQPVRQITDFMPRYNQFGDVIG